MMSFRHHQKLTRSAPPSENERGFYEGIEIQSSPRPNTSANPWDEAIECARKLPPDDPSRAEMLRLLEAAQAGNAKPD